MIATSTESRSKKPTIVIRRFSDRGTWGYKIFLRTGSALDREIDKVTYDVGSTEITDFSSAGKTLRGEAQSVAESYAEHSRAEVCYERRQTPKRVDLGWLN